VHFDEMLAKAAAPRCKRGSHLHSASTTSHAYAKPGRSAHREPARQNNSRSLPASAFIRRPSSSSSTGPSWWTGWSPRSQWPTNTKNCWVSQRYQRTKSLRTADRAVQTGPMQPTLSGSRDTLTSCQSSSVILVNLRCISTFTRKVLCAVGSQKRCRNLTFVSSDVSS